MTCHPVRATRAEVGLDEPHVRRCGAEPRQPGELVTLGHSGMSVSTAGWYGRVTSMAIDGGSAESAHRAVRLERVENSRYLVTNDRGGQITIGTGEGTGFTPVELLLAGIGGCTAIDVDILTSRRAEPESFEVLVDAEKVRDESGNHLAGIVVTFRVRFPGGEQGDKARALLPDVVRMSHDRLCTVSRTVELGTPVASRIE
jgi:putative redox protein